MERPVKMGMPVKMEMVMPVKMETHQLDRYSYIIFWELSMKVEEYDLLLEIY